MLAVIILAVCQAAKAICNKQIKQGFELSSGYLPLLMQYLSTILHLHVVAQTIMKYLKRGWGIK